MVGKLLGTILGSIDSECVTFFILFCSDIEGPEQDISVSDYIAGAQTAALRSVLVLSDLSDYTSLELKPKYHGVERGQEAAGDGQG